MAQSCPTERNDSILHAVTPQVQYKLEMMHKKVEETSSHEHFWIAWWQQQWHIWGLEHFDHSGSKGSGIFCRFSVIRREVLSNVLFTSNNWLENEI